ncbi:MAG: hypothetical protein LBS27_03745 [Bifidobacteriaceae bacterium]|jgi:predicted nucleic acid-binding protein|nr:hypothetical protein [Bifidobacteriaceae bacterium]
MLHHPAVLERLIRCSRLGDQIAISAIAGHAIAAGAVLATNNTREFSRVQGLTCEDWTLPV